MSQSLEQTSEYKSDDQSSHGSSEYHSGQELESERKGIILVNRDEEFTFLKIQFPMPHSYPHLYIQLNELMSTVDLVPKSYDWIKDIAGNPNRALGYIIHHFNINKVSRNIHTFPGYCYNQVHYSTYIDTTQYNSLQGYYKVT